LNIVPPSLMDKTIKTNPTPYSELNAVLGELVESAQVVLGESFVAACLQGSFAVGEFDRHSDVDFIIVVEAELSEDQVLALQIMHERIYNLNCEWARHLEGMNSWARQIQVDPEIINNSFFQTFAVLHYCRMLYDLHTGFPGSKRGGTEWAKSNLDPAWVGLIDRAWDGRPDPALSARQPADPEDLKSTVEFVRYIIDACAPFAIGEIDDEVGA
jgi:predicted nucleotidyltransferase